jgi:hypothetical protein
MSLQVGNLSKFIVTLFGMASTAIQTYWATATWAPIATAALTAIVVYLVPNAPVTSAVKKVE